MQKGFLKLLFFVSLQYIVLHASVFIPKSSAFNKIKHVLIKEPLPTYVKTYIHRNKEIHKQQFPEEAFNSYKEKFQKIKLDSGLNTEKMLLETKNSPFQNGELNFLLVNLQKEPSVDAIEALIDQECLTALKKLRIKNIEQCSIPELRKEFCSYIKDKNDIKPCFSLPLKEKAESLFQSILASISEKEITNINYILEEDINPALLSAYTDPRESQYAYKIVLSEHLPLYETLFQFAHEMGHTIELDSHKIQKAQSESFGGSIPRKILNYRNIEPYMANFCRFLECKADTNIILKLSKTNPELAKELCVHGINTITNKIALEAVKHMGTGGESGPAETLTSHQSDGHHPSWSLRLALLLKIYEALQH